MLSANWGTWRGRTGMICVVPDPRAARKAPTVTAPPDQMRVRWWSRLSPWLSGALILLVVAGIAVTQVPRLPTVFSAGVTRSSSASSTASPVLSGLTYTQSTVADREFVDQDLRGDQLVDLDLRGKDFQGADAAGAIFAGSFLNGANFSDADLRGADLRDTCLRGVNFTGAELAGADFTGAEITGATVVTGATSETVGWTSISASRACP